MNMDQTYLQTESTEADSRKRVHAAFASGILPGTGQFILGEKWEALAYLALFLLPELFIRPIMLASHNSHLWVQPVCFFVPLLAGVLSVKTALRGEKKASPPRASRKWMAFAIPLMFVCLLVYHGVAMYAAGCRTYVTRSSNMEPTIYRGDSVVMDSRAYVHTAPSRGDIIVYTPASGFHNSALQLTSNLLLARAKRVVAVPGDIISSSNSTLYVNGHNSVYVLHPGSDPIVTPDFGPFTIPQGFVFAMDDNQASPDSSQIALTLPSKAILGKALYITRSRHDTARKSLQ